jgi:hypothetical protein
LGSASASIGVTERLEAWLSAQNGQEPDVVAGIAYYGNARLQIRGWKKLPFDVPEAERDEWREQDFLPTIDEVWDFLAGAAGGFLEAAGHNPGVVIQLIKKQLAAKTQLMVELASKPLEYYIPEQPHSGKEFEGEEWDEWFEASLDEFGKHNEVFALREQLHCFELAMEYLRLFCFEEAPELGLPNKGLFAALSDVDLNLLIGTFDKVDPKLKTILKHLAARKIDVNEEDAPEAFWWRHWKQRPSQKRT